jgi:hypothetical protein
MKKEIKKQLLPFIPPILLDFYYKIKRKNFPPINRKNEKTSSWVITTKTVSLNEDFIKNNRVDTVRIEKYMEWINPFNARDVRKYQYSKFDFSLKGENEITLDFTNYGLWTINIEYYCNKNCVKKETKAINIEAQEYNIAYLAATLPVEILITKLWDITTPNSPTIIGLERVLVNYEALPQNVFPFPLASQKELYAPYKGFNGYSQRLVSYIGTLHRLNPNAKFNLYLCDHQAYYSLALMYANGIPEKNFNVYLLSDGTGSYWCSNNIFNSTEAEKNYSKMRNTLLLSKQKALESGVQEWGKETFVTCGEPCVSTMKPRWDGKGDLSIRTAYAFVFAKENSNYKWILHNPQMLRFKNQDINALSDSVCKVNFVKDIKQLEKHREELNRLLDIDYSYFDKSYKNNKKICLLMCSFPPLPADEKYIDETMRRFGSEYDYYIKDHPWTSEDAKRIQKFNEKGITFLNPKIPTEIYMMIDSKIYIAGYISSVFLSIDMLDNPSKQVLSVWDSKTYIVKTDYINFIAETAMSIENEKVVVYEKTH